VSSLITEMSSGDRRQSTIIRIILSIALNSTTVAGAWGTQRVDLAIGMASQEAFTAETLPDPVISTDKPSRGWMYRTSKMVSQNVSGGQILFPIEVDLRAARKIEQGILYMIWDNSAVEGTSFTVRLSGLIRVLVKL